jgi:hypothetical protein
MLGIVNKIFDELHKAMKKDGHEKGVYAWSYKKNITPLKYHGGSLGAVHVLLSRFYSNFILILFRFYPNFIQILVRFYQNILETHIILIIPRFG